MRDCDRTLAALLVIQMRVVPGGGGGREGGVIGSDLLVCFP